MMHGLGIWHSTDSNQAQEDFTMDSASIYVEDGSEDPVIPKLVETKQRASRLSKLASVIYHRYEDPDPSMDDGDISEGGHQSLEISEIYPTGSEYSLREVYFLSINYILGVGCLGIPYAFARAGFILCLSILVIVTIFSYMTVLWVAETGVRFEKDFQRISENRPTENSPLMNNLKGQNDGRHEVIDLVDFYLGRSQKYLYQASLMTLMYIGLLAYSQVFCGAISAVVWGGRDDAWLGGPQIVFGMMVIPLSCMELEEQVSIQAIMATARFVAIFTIVLGSMSALFLDDSFSERTHVPYFATPDKNSGTMSYTACFSGFGIAFSASLFSQLFQHSIPGLLRPLKHHPDKLPFVPRTIAASLLTTSGFYLLLGVTAASYFGSSTRSSINLNFSDFHFGMDPSTASKGVLIICKIISGIVVIFPALDTISVFPLIANTLGNNLYAAAGGDSIKFVAEAFVHYQSLLGGCTGRNYRSLSTAERAEALQKANRISLIIWRLVSAIPPLFASLYTTDLSFSFLLAGVAGVHVAFFAPSLLQIQSLRSHDGKTIYSGWHSSPMWCIPVLVFGVFSLGVVSVQIKDAIGGGI